jgi:hypothetical protein
VKRWPSLTAAITGLIIGFLCATYVGICGRTRDIPHSTSNGDCHYPVPCHLRNLVEFLARPSIECAFLWRHSIRHFKVAIQAQILTSEIELVHYGLRR